MNYIRTRSLLLFWVLLFAVLPAASACAEKDQEQALPYYVSDTAGLLTAEEQTKLEETAERISQQYQCGVYVVTLDDYRAFGNFNSYWDFSQAFYSRYQMGLGDSHDGILLIMSMAERDYSLLAYGSNAHYAFTDYGKEVLENQFLDDFRRNDWYSGFHDYIDGCGELLARAAAGEPLDVSYDSRSGIPDSAGTAIVIAVPMLVAFGACEGMKRKMKPVGRQNRADEYVVPGGIHLSLKRDVFLNRTVTRTVIHTENRDSSSGGGGTTVNSQGFSGHSGKF